MCVSKKDAQDPAKQLMRVVTTAQQSTATIFCPSRWQGPLCTQQAQDWGDGMQETAGLEQPHHHVCHPLRNCCEMQTIMGLGSRCQLLLNLTVENDWLGFTFFPNRSLNRVLLFQIFCLQELS